MVLPEITEAPFSKPETVVRRAVDWKYFIRKSVKGLVLGILGVFTNFGFFFLF